MATPAAVVSSLVKIDGLQTSLNQLGKFDNANRKASGSADKFASATKSQNKTLSEHSSRLGTAAKAVAGMVLAYAGFSFVKSAVTDTVALSGSVAKLTAITGMDAKQASLWIEIMKVRGVETRAVSVGFITLARNMRSATNGSAKAADAFKELGISEGTLKSGDMNEVLLQSADAFAKMRNPAERAALAQQLFGRQAQSLLPIMSKGRQGIEDALASAERYGAFLPKNVSTLNKAREAQRNMNLAMDGFKISFATAVMPSLMVGVQALLGFIAQIRNGTGAGGVFGEIVSTAFNAVKTAVSFVVSIVSAFISQIQNGTGVGGAFASVVNIIVGVLVTLFGIGKSVVNTIVGFVNAVIQGKTWAVVLTGAIAGMVVGFALFQAGLLAVRGAMLVVTAAQWLYNAALNANPIGIVIVAISAFIGALVALYMKVGWFRDMVNSTWQAIQTAAQVVFPIIVSVVTKAWDLIKGYTMTVFNAIKDVISGVFSVIRGVINIFAGLFTGDFGRMWNGIKQIFSGAAQAILGILSALTAPFRAVAGVIMGALSGGISAAWNGIKGLFHAIGQTMVDVLSSFFSAMYNVGKFLFNAIWGGMKSVAQGILNSIWWFIGAIIDVINTPLHWIGVGGIAKPAVPKLAQGGVVSADEAQKGMRVTRPLAIVGEQAPKHPEYVIPTNPAYRSNALSLLSAAGNSLGVPGFQFGGILDFGKKLLSVAAGAVIPAPLQAVLDMGGGAAIKGLIAALPDVPGLPDSLGALPKYVLGKVVDWLTNTVSKGIDKAGGGPVVQRMISAMNAIAAQHFPYVYGGGHNGAFSGPYDCSGLVSAILHSGGFINSPMATDGLKVWGDSGSGRAFTVGVRGSTGMNAHTMMKIGNRYLESGSGHGAQWVNGWSGNFPILRHAPGYARGGVFSLLDYLFPPDKFGWGLANGGVFPPFAGSFASGGIVPGPAGAPRTVIAHGGEPVGGPLVNIENLNVASDFDERSLAHRLAFLLEM